MHAGEAAGVERGEGPQEEPGEREGCEGRARPPDRRGEGAAAAGGGEGVFFILINFL